MSLLIKEFSVFFTIMEYPSMAAEIEFGNNL